MITGTGATMSQSRQCPECGCVDLHADDCSHKRHPIPIDPRSEPLSSNSVVAELRRTADNDMINARTISNLHQPESDNVYGREATLKYRAADEIERLLNEAAMTRMELQRLAGRIAEGRADETTEKPRGTATAGTAAALDPASSTYTCKKCGLETVRLPRHAIYHECPAEKTSPP